MGRFPGSSEYFGHVGGDTVSGFGTPPAGFVPAPTDPEEDEMSDWMDLADKERERRENAPKGPVIEGVQFPSPADLRWRAEDRFANAYAMDKLRVVNGTVGSGQPPEVEVNGTRLATGAAAEGYYRAIKAAFAERKRQDDDRHRRAALAHVQKLSQDPQL